MKRIISMLLAALVCVGLVGITASAEDYYLGDANKDEWIDNLDAALLLKYDAGLMDLDESVLALSDTNYDGYVDNMDAALILKYDAGLVWDFCETHSWVEATCIEAKYCDYCFLTVGEALGHNVEDGACTNEGCAYTDAKQKAFEDLRDYIIANGEHEEGSYGLYRIIDDTSLITFIYMEEYPDAISLAWITATETDNVMVGFDYTPLYNEQVAVYLKATEEDAEIAMGYIDITAFNKENPEFVEFDGSMASDSEAALKATADGMVLILDEFAAFLEESDLGYTLADLGFVAY